MSRQEYNDIFEAGGQAHREWVHEWHTCWDSLLAGLLLNAVRCMSDVKVVLSCMSVISLRVRLPRRCCATAHTVHARTAVHSAVHLFFKKPHRGALRFQKTLCAPHRGAL